MFWSQVAEVRDWPQRSPQQGAARASSWWKDKAFSEAWPLRLTFTRFAAYIN
jgi:hypothetical protein